MSANADARKIGALLAKAERTDNPHEAEAYTRKAEALMVKLGISEAMARQSAGADVKPEAIIERRVDLWVNPYSATTWWPADSGDMFECAGCGRTLPARKYPTTKNRGERGRECRECRDGRYNARQAARGESNAYNREHVVGWHGIARSLGADTYYVGDFAALYVVGFESDVARIEILVRSLKVQVMLSMWSWWSTGPAERRSAWNSGEATSARRDYVIAFYSAVARRLRDHTRTVADATPGAALALRDKAADLRDHMDNMTFSKRHRGRSYGGSEAGARAGMAANLGGNAVSGGRRALKG